LALADSKTSRASTPSPVAMLAIPDLAAGIAVVTLAYCLFVFHGGTQFFRDSDSGWHIRNGEWILDHRSLPRSDPYSFSKAGQPWLGWEWGADVLMGLAHRIDGLRGVTTLFALTISACTWMWFRLNFAAGGDFFVTCLLAPLMITTTSLHWLARPHVFSWLLLLGSLWYFERAPFHPSAQGAAAPSHSSLTPPRSSVVRGLVRSLRQLAAVAGVAALWANLHASFLLAPVIALIYAASHLIRPVLWPIDPEPEQAKARRFLWVAMAALIGSFLNPYGWRLHAHVLAYLRDDALLSRIAEFQSFNFHDPGAMQVALAVVLAAAGGTMALAQGKAAHFLLAAIFAMGALRMARMLPLLALSVLPLVNGTFAEALRGARNLRPRLKRSIDAAFAYSARLRAIDQRMNGAAFTAIAAVAILLAARTPVYSRGIGFPAGTFPVNAAAAVENLPADARLVAPDNFGGYLIYRFNGARKVYFDGRSDFYGVDFMKQYLVLINARPGWQETLHSFRFTHALLPDASALKAALQQAGWTTLYKDDVATLLEAH